MHVASKCLNGDYDLKGKVCKKVKVKVHVRYSYSRTINHCAAAAAGGRHLAKAGQKAGRLLLTLPYMYLTSYLRN